MVGQIIAVYCVCEDLLRALRHEEDGRRKVWDAEVMTVALVAVLYFGGNFSLSALFLVEQGYLPVILSRSRYIRRLHAIKELFLTLFSLLGEHWKALNEASIYLIDSFPLPSCDNARIRRSRRYQGKPYRGYIASKRRYFYGIRLHLLVTQAGQPVEFFLTPGCDNEAGCLDLFDFDLPPESQIIGDKAFNHYVLEDVLAEADIFLRPLRKSNSKRAIPPWETWLREHYRKRIETTGSQIMRRFPKSIHATTQQGFELKIVLFILAHSLDALSCPPDDDLAPQAA